MPEMYEVSAQSDLPPLPAGVGSVSEWGRTIIKFGQYQNLNMSYAELVTSKDDRMISYVKWCKSRMNTATGQLRDLCLYMKHFFNDDDASSGVQIPGTNQKRQFKQ